MDVDAVGIAPSSTIEGPWTSVDGAGVALRPSGGEDRQAEGFT